MPAAVTGEIAPPMPTSAVPDSLISDMTSSPVALLCCLAIPVLSLLAYAYWAKMTRRTLLHWRNALGLVAMLVVSSEWLLHTLAWVFYCKRSDLTVFVKRD